MTDHEEHNDVTRNNSINLNDFYNLNRCLGGNCISNFVPEQFPVPPIEELALDKQTNEERNLAFQSAVNETAFEDSSPIFGDIEQMYVPITKEQSELYPTPSVVNEEIRNIDAQRTAQNNNNNNKDNNNENSAQLLMPYAVTRESLQYLNGFIRTQIGRRVSIDFLIGSGTTVTKTGYLLAVAQNYLLINELDTNDVTACDLYTMKFIRFYY